MRNYGCTGGIHSGTWLCSDADDCFLNGGMCFSCGLYLYDISVEQNLTDAVYFLSHYLDVDGSRSCNLFRDCEKEDWMQKNNGSTGTLA